MRLRDHQADDVARLLLAFGRHRRVLYVLPTGAGKTVVAAALIRAWRHDGRRVLFLAHRRELVLQAVERLGSYGVPDDQIGVIMASDARVSSIAPIQVASMMTLLSRPMPKADVVVVDEAHHIPAASYQRVLEETNATLLGLTATPERLDGKGLNPFFDEMIVGPPPSSLVELGHIAPVRTWTVPEELLPDMRGVPIRGGEFDQGALGAVMNRRVLIGNLVEHWMRHGAGRPTVVFATTVEHSLAITAAFQDAGVKAEHVDGRTPTAERDTVLGRLKSGATQVVVNCGVLLEGWDAPTVSCVVMARPTRSLSLFLQMVGRGTRPNGGESVLLDHAGNALVHGAPQQDRVWSLQSKRRRKGAPPSAKACPVCSEVLPRLCSECPCGHVFWEGTTPPEELEGELRELVIERECALCGLPRKLRRRPGKPDYKRHCAVCSQLLRWNPGATREQALERMVEKQRALLRSTAKQAQEQYLSRLQCKDCGQRRAAKKPPTKEPGDWRCRPCAMKAVWQDPAYGRHQSLRPRECECGAALGKRNNSGRCQRCWAAGWKGATRKSP